MKLLETCLSESNAMEGVYDKKSLKFALEAWKYLIKEEKLTQKNILQTHRILMQEHLKAGEGLGAFRRKDVFIGGRLGKPPHLLADLIARWTVNANDLVKNGKYENPSFIEKMLKKQHVDFEVIHPFIDGNGRVGRILLNWQRVKLGFEILILWGKERYNYYNWFD